MDYPSVKISLLVTYYNEKTLLTECLQSAFAQTVLPDEIIVYDDAGPFPAVDYLPNHELSKKVRVIRGEKNIMIAGARNRLLREATCEYVHFLDADDLLVPECFETLKEAFKKEPADVYVNEVKSVMLDTNKPISDAVLELHKLPNAKSITDFAIRGCLLPGSTTFKPEDALAIGGFRSDELLQAEDYEFNVRLVYNARTIKVISKPLMIQRFRKDGLSKNGEQCYLEGMKAIRLLVKYLPKEYHQSLAVRSALNGKIFYEIKNIHAAEDAFMLANQLSPDYINEDPLLYRKLTKLFGQMSAEKISEVYRDLLPRRLRAKMKFISRYI